MSKIKYLIARIFKMNYRGMFDKINEVNVKTGKSKVFLFFDVVMCGILYQAGYIDYALFEMYNLNRKQRKTIMTRGKNNAFIRKLNDKKYINIFGMKDQFNNMFGPYLKRDWLEFEKTGKEEFLEFISKHDFFMVKPIGGMCGKGIQKIKTKEHMPDELYNHIKKSGPVILEEVIEQHPEMNYMHPTSINTCRIVTIVKDGKVTVVATYFRVGNGKFVDNFNSGGMVVPINKEKGVIEYNALDKLYNLYEEHPMTGTKFIGFKIPMWEEALDLVKEAALVIPEVGMVGWDVAISVKGPLLVEANDFPGHDIYQLPPHRTNGIGVLPDFKKAIK